MMLLTAVAMSYIAKLFAVLAISAQGYALPTHFVENFDQAVPASNIIGLEWPCGGRYNDETCWAGLSLYTMTLETGP